MNRWKIALACGALVGVAIPKAGAFTTFGAWPNGNFTLTLQLDSVNIVPKPTGGFSDGSPNWDAAVAPVVDLWSAHMIRSKLLSTTSTSTVVTKGTGVNHVFFSSTIYGQPFGSRVLAVTLNDQKGASGIRFDESDVVFNSGVTWNSYRGALRPAVDIRRVALHEFGHVLGLNHPDQDDPPQTVSSIMNSAVSNTETLQPDDIAGASALYPAPISIPTITTPLQNRTVSVDGDATLSIGLNGGGAPASSPILQYAWLFTPPGGALDYLFTDHEGVLLHKVAQLDDAGSYQVEIDTPQGEVMSNTATVAVAGVTNSSVTRLANISTRGNAGVGSRALIAGFVVVGGQSRRVLIRAIGPTLAASPFNLSGVVSDTQLDLTTSSGAALASNNHWGAGTNTESELNAAFSQVGAFGLPSGSHDSALIASLAPGAYTASVSPANASEGLALVEVYDLDAATPQDSRLTNISTRGVVGSSILIAGFVVNGPGPRTYLMRAVGDSLTQFGVSGTLDDPKLALYDNTGTRIREADDWDSPTALQSKLSAAFTQVGAFALTDRQESAMLLTLNPGQYTLHLSGFGGGVGTALVEVYEMGP